MIKDMINAGASEQEEKDAVALFELLKPALKIKRNGRINTSVGDKTPLGLYRTISRIMIN